MSKKWVREARKKSASKQEPDVEPRMSKRLVRPLGQGEAFARWLRAARRL